MPRGREFIDLTGKRFGRLTVLSLKDRTPSRNIRWLCQCDCGNVAIVHGSSLRYGTTKSCGCLQAQRTSEANKRHGCSNDRIHHEWAAMKARCYNPNNKRYERYGRRGITVCPEWLDSFESFRDWAMANGYRDDLTIDRIDNDGPYSPDNCRWTTNKEQQNNKCNNIKIEFQGETLSAKQWAEKKGINYHTFYRRLKSGWPIEKALTKPVRKTS